MVDQLPRRKELGLPGNGGEFAARANAGDEIELQLPGELVDELSRSVLDLHPDATAWTVREDDGKRVIEVIFADGSTAELGEKRDPRRAGSSPKYAEDLLPHRNELNGFSPVEARGSPEPWVTDIAADLRRTRPDLATVTFGTVEEPGGFFWSIAGVGVRPDGEISDVDLVFYIDKLDGPGRSRALKADDQMMIDLRSAK